MSKHDRFLKAALVWASAIASMVFAASIFFSNRAHPSPRPDLEPPARYLVNPGVPVDIRYARNAGEICVFLSGDKFARACAIPAAATRNNVCIIYMPTPDNVFGRDPWVNLIMRHELAHCYGWEH